MENVNAGFSNLDHLLQIESKAAALVNDAQEEADKRIKTSEEKNRLSYEERYRVEIQMLEASLQKNIDKVKKQYKEALDDYQNEISKVDVNIERFSALLNEYLTANFRREG